MTLEGPCGCIGHRYPGVEHIAPCCDTPHITQAEYLRNIEHVQHINYNEVAIGHIDDVRETPEGIVASGGWCAPSETLYEMSQTYDGPSLPDEPDPLPVINEETTYTEYVVEPSTDFYDHPEVYDTLEQAQARFDERMAHTTADEAISIVERVVTKRVIAAQHGTYVPPPPDPNATERIVSGLAALLPQVPVRRGGIQFRLGNPITEREGD